MAAKTYPDLEELFARRAVGRTERARLSFAEKLEMLEELKAGADAFQAIRAQAVATPQG